MSQPNQQNKSDFNWVGAIAGGLLLSLPAASQVASAQSASPLNPCPGIYYEEPFNSAVEPPAGCPANAAMGTVGGLEPTVPADAPAPAADVTQPPLPETRSDAIARVMPTEGTVNVRLINNTNAIGNYQAIGHTDQLPLPGGEEVFLQNLPTPITVSVTRQDDGFFEVIPVSSDEGTLVISLEEEVNPVDRNQGVLRIQEDGQVLLN
jgi:hypothetical protein